MTEETKKPEPGTGYQKQSFLIGEQLYLRPVSKADAEYSTAIRSSRYPVSKERTEEWIKEVAGDDPWGDNDLLVIVRKHDDVVIGSALVNKQPWSHAVLNVRVDPLYGDAGQKLRAQALQLLRDHYIDEAGVPSLMQFLPASDTVYLEELHNQGWVETARHREMMFVNGKRTDRVIMQTFDPRWVEKLGDPMEMPLERTGTGKPRPVPAPVGPVENPPKGALMVGNRVYLKALSREHVADEIRMARQETETFFDIGRHLPSATGMSHWLDDIEKKDPPGMNLIGAYLLENDVCIGNVMVITPNFTHRSCETGSWLFRPEYRGSGYGSEAKHLLLEYIFDVLGFHMVESWVLFPNTRSAAALRKQGYREAGRMCWVYPYDGGFGNGVLFDLLADEWRAMPRETR